MSIKVVDDTFATSYMLAAVGTEDVQVRLRDIASRTFAHTLSGHRDDTWQPMHDNRRPLVR